MTQGQNDTKSERASFCDVAQHPHLPAGAPAGLLSRKAPSHPHLRRGLSRNKAGEASNQWRGTRHPNLGEVQEAAAAGQEVEKEPGFFAAP